jgi:hypothetical protein
MEVPGSGALTHWYLNAVANHLRDVSARSKDNRHTKESKLSRPKVVRFLPSP